MTITDDTTDEQYRDDSGLAGVAVGVCRIEGDETPGIVRGTRDVSHNGETVTTRVLVELEAGGLVDTDADRVEVV